MAKKGERKEAWFRIIVAVISGAILSVWANLTWILLVLNWLVTIFSGNRSKGMAEFCEYWNTEMYKFMRYITFVSNKRPFPFSSLERMSKFS
ncbi:MAG: DUF4389 domain-containing protein [Candidatus Pacearchaeota archaeon]